MASTVDGDLLLPCHPDSTYGIDVQPSLSWIRAQSRQLVDAVYERMPWGEGPGSSVELWSPVLQLELGFADG